MDDPQNHRCQRCQYVSILKWTFFLDDLGVHDLENLRISCQETQEEGGIKVHNELKARTQLRLFHQC